MVQETDQTKSGFWRNAVQSVVFPAPEGAEITKRMPVRRNCWDGLFKVGYLFADPIEFSLGLHDPT